MSINGIVCDKEELLGSEGIWWLVLHNSATSGKGRRGEKCKRARTPTEEAMVLFQGWS